MATVESKAQEARHNEKFPPPTFEDLLDQIGPFGLYQRAMCVALIGGSTLLCSMTYYAQLLIMLTPPASCQGVPANGQTDGDCRLHFGSINEERVMETARFLENASINGNLSDVEKTVSDGKCRQWSYDTTELFDTIASEVRSLSRELGNIVLKQSRLHHLYYCFVSLHPKTSSIRKPCTLKDLFCLCCLKSTAHYAQLYCT